MRLENVKREKLRWVGAVTNTSYSITCDEVGRKPGLQYHTENTADVVDRGVCVRAGGVEVVNISTDDMVSSTGSVPSSVSRSDELMVTSVCDDRSQPRSVGTVCKNKQARADSDYEHGYGDRNETITLTREVERVGVVPGPSGVCAPRCSTFFKSHFENENL